MQLGYFSRLKNDSQRWVDKGIIGEFAASEILADVQAQKRGYSFSTIVAVLGVVCLGFAAMTFVAANWDEMPRYVRVLFLVSNMWLAYFGAVIARYRNRPVLADVLVTLGCAIFGATIMLVGQIYHLQGKSEDAVLLWAGGTLLASFIVRSSSTLWLATALFILWFGIGIGNNLGKDIDINFLYLVFWALCAFMAYWLRAIKAAHLLTLGLVAWLGVTAIILTTRHDTLAYFLTLYCALFVCISFAIVSLQHWKIFHEFEAAFIPYMVICLIGLTACWIMFSSFEHDFAQKMAELNSINYPPVIACLILAVVIFIYGFRKKVPAVYDLGFCVLWVSAAIFITSSISSKIPFLSEAMSLGLSIWLIRMGARLDVANVTRLGYLAFAMVMLQIYFRTVGTLIGTTGFYLVSGVLLVLCALLLPRVFKMMRKNKAVAA